MALSYCSQLRKGIALPITVAVLFAFIASLSGAGLLNCLLPSTLYNTLCTLSTISGNVEVQNAESNILQEGTDGMTLRAGDRVKTTPDSYAVVTFFEGSTIKLEPNTDVEIQRLEHVGEQSVKILLKQWLGKSRSHVEKMANPGSYYEIQTPSASVIVMGTLFVTGVDEAGSTIVQTIEGLVTVAAQNAELNVPAGYESRAELGSVPSQPILFELPGQSDEGPPGQSDEGPPR